MLNQEKIKEVAEQSDTSKVIFKSFSERSRFRRQTNLNQFQMSLMNKGEKIVDQEFIETFKSLEMIGAGSLVIGRRGKPNRFIWDYNLKHIAQVVKDNKLDEIQKLSNIPLVKKVTGRPRGRPRKNQELADVKETKGVILTIRLSPLANANDLALLVRLADKLSA